MANRITIGLFSRPGDEAKATGLLEIVKAVRPQDELNFIFCSKPIDIPTLDVIAATPRLGWLPSGIDLDDDRVLCLSASSKVRRLHQIIDPALFEPVSECPTRTLQRIVILPHLKRGFADLSRSLLARITQKWSVQFLGDQPDHAATACSGIDCRILPRGRRWLDVVLASDLVIAQTPEDAMLANATLRPAILTNAVDLPDLSDFPFIWAVDEDGFVDTIDAYDANHGGATLFNWKRELEAVTRNAVDSWLVSAGR